MKVKNLYYLIIGLLIGTLFPIQSLFADNLNNPIKLIINGKTIQCDVPPQNINGRVLVPARFVAEPLGATVDWDGVNKTVIINSRVNQNQTQNNNRQTTPQKENPKPIDPNNPPMVDGYIDANNNGTPDWVEQSSSHIFNDKRMVEPITD